MARDDDQPSPQPLRALPSVHALAEALRDDALAPSAAPGRYVEAARRALRDARATLRAGGTAPSPADLQVQARALLAAEALPALRPVLNATGVILNTNLGRAPLAEEAIEQVVAVARGYSTLEYDLATGGRGSRQAHIREALRQVTGAEDGIAVNNNAAAVLLALTALAAGREVVISRGELVEIGGGFRVPDVLRQSGATLVEVGTTNRTRLADYAQAITERTALLLVVHPSNFRVVGFTEQSPLADLVALAHARGLPLVHDLGSGALSDTTAWGLASEPTVGQSIAAGADLICFSGDKLLGGPQAGILVGRAVYVTLVERHPLARALRLDKLTLAALEATLRLHRDGLTLSRLPTWWAIARPVEEVRARAIHWARELQLRGLPTRVVEGESTVGGGSLPGETLPTFLCAIAAGKVHEGALAAALRAGEPPVLARVLRDEVLLDPRTIAPREEAALLAAVAAAYARCLVP